MRFDPPIPFADYLLTERVGLGGTAEIFRAVRRGRRPGEPPVALKRLLPHVAEDPVICRLLLREVGALERVTHPSVVRLLAHGEVRGLPYLVMEYVDGCNLRAILAPPGVRHTMPAAIALWIVAHIARGLAEAWRHGVVHRDVSPPNVQVTAAGVVKILAFGLARVRGMAQTPHGQGLKGKWAYLAPEQIEGLPLDGRADLFALGSVAYELLVGRPPFRGDNREDTLSRIREHRFTPLPGSLEPGAIPLQCPDGLPRVDDDDCAALINSLLAHDREDRPAGGDEVADRCAELLGGGDALAQPRYARWLGKLAREHDRPGELWQPSAAEHRGEVVTDPAGETVTAVGQERAPQRSGGRRAVD